MRSLALLPQHLSASPRLPPPPRKKEKFLLASPPAIQKHTERSQLNAPGTCTKLASQPPSLSFLLYRLLPTLPPAFPRHELNSRSGLWHFETLFNHPPPLTNTKTCIVSLQRHSWQGEQTHAEGNSLGNSSAASGSGCPRCEDLDQPPACPLCQRLCPAGALRLQKGGVRVA